MRTSEPRDRIVPDENRLLWAPQPHSDRCESRARPSEAQESVSGSLGETQAYAGTRVAEDEG